MAATLLQGQPIADQIRAELAEELAAFKREYGHYPRAWPLSRWVTTRPPRPT